MAGHEAARRAMIDSQLRTSGVNAEWVLRRMAEVPREQFVPESARGHAYIDRAIPLGDGRHLAAPVVQGMMLQEAKPTAEDKALVVDGAIEQLPEALAGRLVEEGRVVTGLLSEGITRLAIGRKVAGEIGLLPLAEIGIPVLPEFAAPKRWSF